MFLIGMVLELEGKVTFFKEGSSTSYRSVHKNLFQVPKDSPTRMTSTIYKVLDGKEAGE